MFRCYNSFEQTEKKLSVESVSCFTKVCTLCDGSSWKVTIGERKQKVTERVYDLLAAHMHKEQLAEKIMQGRGKKKKRVKYPHQTVGRIFAGLSLK